LEGKPYIALGIVIGLGIALGLAIGVGMDSIKSKKD